MAGPLSPAELSYDKKAATARLGSNVRKANSVRRARADASMFRSFKEIQSVAILCQFYGVR